MYTLIYGFMEGTFTGSLQGPFLWAGQLGVSVLTQYCHTEYSSGLTEVDVQMVSDPINTELEMFSYV